jgi:uncharacterized protein involved in exopolysaccharide biosynthesis
MATDKTRNKKSTASETPELTLRDILRPLFRHRFVVGVTFGLVFAASVYMAWAWANRYYVATMQIVVDRARLDPTVTAQPTAALQGADRVVTSEDVASEVALLQGRDMLREVAQTCKMVDLEASSWNSKNPHDQDFRKAAALESATQGLAGSIKVEAQKTSRVIDVRYGSTRSPETTACVLQTLAKLYLQKHLRLQRPPGALDFFAQETSKYEQALAESESRLVKFSKLEGIAAPEVLRTDLAQELIAAQTNLSQTRQAIAADRQRIENIKTQMDSTPSRSPTTEASVSANLLLDNLQSTLLAAQLKRTQLLMKYDLSYPLVKEVDAEIAQTTEAIAAAEKARYVNTTTDRDETFEYLRQDRAKTEADLASDEARAAALQTSIHDIQAELVKSDAKAVEQAALVREAKANEESYLLYLTKREQERTSNALDDKHIANVAIAVPPNVPVLPARSPFSVMFAGFWTALLCAIVAGYLAELADQSFRTPAEVEETLNIPILAAVPKQVA